MSKRRSKKCKSHQVGMIYFYGWICPVCFPHWGKAPVTEFDVAMQEFLKRDQAA